jgi:SNW domain-containing protein 1
MMRETLREHRMAKAGRHDRDEDRDISESIALGRQVQPTARGGESAYDARLFNQDAGGIGSGFGSDEIEAFDSKLFADRAQATGYRYDAGRVGAARDEMEDAEALKQRKRPMLGGESATGERAELRFVTEDGEDAELKKPRHH